MFESEGKKHFLTASSDWLTQQRWQSSPAWLKNLRQQGRRKFEEMGLPDRRLEDWKYIDIGLIAGQPFSPPSPVQTSLQKTAKLRRLIDRELSPWQMVFVNGFYSPTLSSLKNLPPGAEIESLAGTLAKDHPLAQEYLATIARQEESSFVALNTAFIEDGAFIHLPANTILTHPIHLVFINLEKDIPHVLHPRNLVILDRGAKAIVIEEYVGDPESAYLTNSVTEIVLSQQAELDHYKLQLESPASFHIGFIQALQEESSRFASHSVTLGAELSRTNIYSTLAGTNAACLYNGLYMIHGEQQADTHTLICHQGPGGHSQERFHGIVDGSAHGIFTGKIYVDRQAQKTDSYQVNRNLLLSKQAVVDTKPQLEIFADDVKCSHGTSVGRIDQDALYYLQSRGISGADAREMLTLAFAHQVLDRFGYQPLRFELEKILVSQLKKWFQKDV